MKTMLKILVAMGVASAALAQNEPVLRPSVFNQQTFEFVSAQLISGPPVKGAPYSAEAVNETVQTLADGNRIVQRTSAMQYRDADGRERREETSAMGVVFITDPVAGTTYTLHPDSRSAEKNPIPTFNATPGAGGDVFFYSNRQAPGVPAGVSGPVSVAIGGRAFGGRGGPGDAPQLTIATAGRLVTGSADTKTEQLGNMSIEGVQAQGTRTTTTIPAGEIGNDKPIDIVDERWYSPDLQMTVMTKHSDPRMGETSFALKNINRSSPPAYLFEIPADYSVKSGPVGPTIHVERRE